MNNAFAPHRLVLAALLAPLLGLGIVLWFLLPGGVGLTYTPSQYSQAVQFRPGDWSQRQVAVRGYIVFRPCPSRAMCAPGTKSVLLADAPPSSATLPSTTAGIGFILVLPQQESGWHALLRRILPGMAVPFPSGLRNGDRVTITGTLQGAPRYSSYPVLEPSSL